MQKFLKNLNKKGPNWYFHFWPFLVAFENFFTEGFSTMVRDGKHFEGLTKGCQPV